MKILHTSDWHLGQSLMSKDRKQEHELFLKWLIRLISEKKVDVLIVAGDIFDSGTPPNYAFQLYYDFLHQILKTQCNQIVILGGNHDSISSLHAPKEILKLLNIHVVGKISQNPEDDTLVIRDLENNPAGIICCVPFLRERDIRYSVSGESYEQKSKALLEGVKNHYRKAVDMALSLRNKYIEPSKYIPLIGTGHLFITGSQTSEGVRDIYVGSLGQVSISSLPQEFDYVALGHLHKPQKVSGFNHIRYSGSPIPLSFGEVNSPKKVIIVEFEEKRADPVIEEINVPVFQKICCLKGNIEEVFNQLKTIDKLNGEIECDGKAWVEIQIDQPALQIDIQSQIYELSKDLPVEILAIRNMKIIGLRDGNLINSLQKEMLRDLNPIEIFEKRLLMEPSIDKETANDLFQTFNQVVNEVLEREEDENQ